MNLEATTIIGFIGALVLMVGFLLNQIGRWTTADFEYDFINLIGAALMAVYGWQIGSYPVIVLFAVWSLFSLKDVFADGFRNIKKGSKAGKEEAKEEATAKEELKEEQSKMEAEQKSKEHMSD